MKKKIYLKTNRDFFRKDQKTNIFEFCFLGTENNDFWEFFFPRTKRQKFLRIFFSKTKYFWHFFRNRRQSFLGIFSSRTKNKDFWDFVHKDQKTRTFEFFFDTEDNNFWAFFSQGPKDKYFFENWEFSQGIFFSRTKGMDLEEFFLQGEVICILKNFCFRTKHLMKCSKLIF